MTGDLIFVDFEKAESERESDLAPSKLSLPKVDKTESRSEKIKRLAAQIESGEYKVDSDMLAEKIIQELSDSTESD
jgi:anti-sigma28 factor (negative regulator of flagellin synthesis)